MTPFNLALLWHLHQPQYRLRGETSCFLPWVRLHALRSYYDMARVLEEFPAVQVTLNLTPVLVEQIRAYEAGASDAFWDVARIPAEDLDPRQRAFVLDQFFSAQHEHVIGDLPRYADLLERRERARSVRGPAEAWREFSTADFRDLQAFLDLAWFGFKAREDFPQLRALRRRGLSFTQENLREIHDIEREILRRVLPLYREAARRGQIEISTSPYAHPILPLLVDSDSAREAMPRAELPPPFRRPEDARAQIDEGLALMERELGVRPRGLWPSEGAVSQAAAEILADAGVAWAASDEQVLAASERDGPVSVVQPWGTEATGDRLALLFRDHALSDRIGFVYARQDPAQAAADFIAAARARAGSERGAPLLLVALDGENPWEHYRRAGAHFLRALYGALSAADGVRAATVSDAVAACPRRGRIRRLRAGSWIHGDLGTWIGGPEKNRAWTILGQVRSALDAPLRDAGIDPARRREARASLHAAEGSDWFWWLDGQFSSDHRLQFDLAFRGHLRQACEALGRDVPDFLNWPVPSPDTRADARSLAEPACCLEPNIDGYEGDFFEWQGAVALGWSSIGAAGSMQRGRSPVGSLRYAFTPEGDFVARIDPERGAGAGSLLGAGVDLSFRRGGAASHLSLELDDSGDLREARLCEGPAAGAAPCDDLRPSAARAAARKILEIRVPAAEHRLAPGEPAGLTIRLRGRGLTVPLREIAVRAPDR